MREYLTTKTVVILVSSVFGIVLITQVVIHRQALQEVAKNIADYRTASHYSIPQPTLEPEPVASSTIAINTDTPYQEKVVIQPKNEDVEVVYTEPDDPLPWGVAQKVDDVTYTIKVGYDERMTTPQEALDALNNYRSTKGVHSLAFDQTLSDYAQSRANHFESIQGTDKHAGFNSFLENEDGFNKLRFNRVGENSFFGGALTGTHLIEWVFTQSPGHNANQLDSNWTHVGVGITATSANFIFGSGQF